MPNKEDVVILSVFTCVVITLIWLFIKCVSSIWSTLFSSPQHHYVPIHTPYIRQRAYVNESIRPNRIYAESFNPRGFNVKHKQVIALDTEYVGAGFKGSISMLARVSLVTREGQVYDWFVKPTMPVTDYRTFVSGIRREDLVDAVDYHKLRPVVANLLEDRILVGHDLKSDLAGLKLTHPTEDIRDTSTYETFTQKYWTHRKIEDATSRKWMNMSHYEPEEMALCISRAFLEAKKSMPPNLKVSLKWLAEHLLKRNIQDGEHSSVEDATAALDLYLLYEKEWEAKLLE